MSQKQREQLLHLALFLGRQSELKQKAQTDQLSKEDKAFLNKIQNTLQQWQQLREDIDWQNWTF